TVEFFDGATSLGIASTADIYGGTTSTWSITTAGLDAGSHSIHAVFTGTADTFNDSTSGNITQTVNQKGLTGSFTAANKTYDGGAAATVQSRTLAGVLAGDAGGVSLGGGSATFDTANAGNGKTVTLTGATLTGTAAGNYSLSSVGTTTADIAKAEATVSVSGYSGTYD
ncbi:MAG: YDG domain-containing protein, partial [Nitrospirota bacterium]